MENLISMADYVLKKQEARIKPILKLYYIESYANFMKRLLELWMFVPCKDGNVLEEKKPFQDNYYEYQQAKERCIFKNFEFVEETEHYYHLKEKGIYVFLIFKDKRKTIESLVDSGFELNKEIL